MSVFNMLSGPCMFPALRFNDSLNNGIFEILLAHGADPNAPLLDRRGAHTAFSHFLNISLSRFLGVECFEGYLRALGSFLQAGASLGIPTEFTSHDVKEAFGNLARPRPEESVLVSYCVELKTLLARLAADPERARFVSSVMEKLILQCSGKDEELGELEVAISEGCPLHIAVPLLRLIESERVKQSSRKRHRESWGEFSGSTIKHFRDK